LITVQMWNLRVIGAVAGTGVKQVSLSNLTRNPPAGETSAAANSPETQSFRKSRRGGQPNR
jgi:hypothetical protein